MTVMTAEPQWTTIDHNGNKRLDLSGGLLGLLLEEPVRALKP